MNAPKDGLLDAEKFTVDPVKATWIIEVLLGALTAVAPLSIDMYLPALPSIARDFAVNLDAVQYSLASFFVGLAIGQLITGPMLDRFGRKRPLMLGLALFSIGAAASGLSISVEGLIFARFVQALGGAAALVASRAIVRDLVSGMEAARMLSRMMVIMGVAPIVAPLIGGWVLGVSSWRYIFLILVILGGLAWIACAFLLPETAPVSHQKESPQRQFSTLLRDSDFMRAALVGAFGSAGMFAYIAGSPFVFIELFGVSADNFGWIFGANAAGLILFSQINRALVGRFPFEAVLKGAVILGALASIVLVAFGSSKDVGIWGILPPLFVFVASRGMVGPNATVLALENHGARAGTASALLGALQFGIAASAAATVSLLHDGTALPMTATVAGFAILSFLVLVAPAGRAARGA